MRPHTSEQEWTILQLLSEEKWRNSPFHLSHPSHLLNVQVALWINGFALWIWIQIPFSWTQNLRNPSHLLAMKYWIYLFFYLGILLLLLSSLLSLTSCIHILISMICWARNTINKRVVVLYFFQIILYFSPLFICLGS